MSGIATASIVESSPSMKKAQPTTSGIRILRRGLRAVSAGEWGSVTARCSARSWPWLTERNGEIIADRGAPMGL